MRFVYLIFGILFFLVSIFLAFFHPYYVLHRKQSKVLRLAYNYKKIDFLPIFFLLFSLECLFLFLFFLK